MTTDDYLINHAYRNVWCVPEQDRQHIFRPDRITPEIGARGSVDIIWGRYTLPSQGDRYHVFQYGNIIQVNLGLELPVGVWTSAAAQMVSESMLIDVYLDSGIMLVRDEVFFLRTRDDNIVVAVKQTPNIPTIGKDPVYTRFYSNEFFARPEQDDVHQGIEYRFTIPASTSQINTLMNHLRQMQQRTGHVFCFVNGWAVNDVNTAIVKRGDRVELVRDSSVEVVHEMAIRSLPVFISDLDEVQKYLIHPPRESNDLIRYRDDVDLFLVRKITPHIHRGVYYHKNKEDSLRMVTHRDYSIPATYVNRFTTMNPGWATTNQLTLKIVVRRAGVDRRIMNEAHHIKELYRLDEDAWHQAVLGAEATVEVWRAENLEKSQYPAMMRARSGTITRQMVESAYGYNTISKLLADTPQKIPGPKHWVELPFGLRGNSTVYEYSSDGKLLGWYLNRGIQWYVPRSEDCRYIEAISGRGGEVMSTVYANNARIVKENAYRCYVSPILNGYPTGDWVDVTGSDEHYDVIDDTIVWKVNPLSWYTAVKYDDTFLTYRLDLDYQDGLLRFSLNVKELRINGNLYTGLVEIPGGLLEIWLNDHPIIEGLDWYMVDKEIVIVNKTYRNKAGTLNRIVIRSTGFCKSDMSREKAAEFGFVENGIMSRNSRWNLRDDKVVRVIADGRLWTRDQLSWSEDRPELVLEDVRNGAPYQVTEPLIPLRGMTYADAYSFKLEADAVDKQIEDYMTMRVGDVDTGDFNGIPYRHVLYSPFVAKLMHDLNNGYIPDPRIQGYYSDVVVRELCEPYLWLLKYEPTRKGFDNRYVAIDAHERDEPVLMNIVHYNFLARAVKVILDDKIDITPLVTIEHLPI